jgi:hypothetical protein
MEGRDLTGMQGSDRKAGKQRHGKWQAGINLTVRQGYLNRSTVHTNGPHSWRACNQEEPWQVDKVGIVAVRGLAGRQGWYSGSQSPGR